MKQLLIISAFLLGMQSLSNSQNFSTFAKGDHDINLGIGLGYTYDWGYGVTSLPEFLAGYDLGIMDFNKIGVLSVGGILGYKHASYGIYQWSWNSYIIAARGKMHLTYLTFKKLDLYGGASLGIRITNGKFNNLYGLNPSTSNVAAIAGIFAGAQYNFTQNFGVYSEIGFDIAYFTIGLNAKIFKSKKSK